MWPWDSVLDCAHKEEYTLLLFFPPSSTIVMECRGLGSYIESCGQKQHRAGRAEQEVRRSQSFWQHDKAEMLYHLGPFYERKKNISICLRWYYFWSVTCSQAYILTGAVTIYCFVWPEQLHCHFGNASLLSNYVVLGEFAKPHFPVHGDGCRDGDMIHTGQAEHSLGFFYLKLAGKSLLLCWSWGCKSMSWSFLKI